MALFLPPGLTPPEISFLCEMELVTVIPRQRMESLQLLSVRSLPSPSPSHSPSLVRSSFPSLNSPSNKGQVNSVKTLFHPPPRRSNRSSYPAIPSIGFYFIDTKKNRAQHPPSTQPAPPPSPSTSLSSYTNNGAQISSLHHGSHPLLSRAS